MREHEKTAGLADRRPEPWLRGTLPELAPVPRAVVHSLEMAAEDIAKWCGGLNREQLHARPFGLPSIAFQLRHIARSLDRFWTYADGRALSAGQLAALAGEQETGASKQEIFDEFEMSLAAARHRLLMDSRQPLETPLKIGRKALPTTAGGLLVHMAEHTQRHVGQAITTAKVLEHSR